MDRACPPGDRPHTFLRHAPSTCPTCERPVEARAVSRDGAVYFLIRCPTCGPGERRVADDAERYLADLIAVGLALVDSGQDGVFKQTTSTCPTCLDLLPCDVAIRAGRVYFDKHCPRCGPSSALVSEDAAYYVRAYGYTRAGTEPREFATRADEGCPMDCGTCSDHEQHTCLPIVEVTDHCNLDCPICIVDNQDAHHMLPEDFRRIVDAMIRREGYLESIALSGGEPTSHPKLLELLAIADRPEIGRVVVITNGLRLGKDAELARALKRSGAYVALQLDGFTEEAHVRLRGRDLTAEKEAALAALAEHDIPTQLIFVAARGVNEDQIGRVVDLLLSRDHILSLNFQPASYSGAGGGQFAHDPLDRLTIPGVIRRIEDQTGGRLRASDFSPLPCSHPQCVSLTYLLRLDDGSHHPFARFVDFRSHGTLLRSSATLGASAEVEDALQDILYDVFAHQDALERGADVLKALRRTVDVMFPDRPRTPKDSLRAGERQAKSIFLHHYMDRHDFDLERLRKCCHHYPQIDDRVMPACSFNLFHRGAARGSGSPLAPWGKRPALALLGV